MLKIIGSLIVIGATTVMGFYFADTYVQRVKQLRAIQYALAALESEIVYTATPLIEAFHNVSEKCEEPLKKLFLNLSNILREKKINSISTAFNEAIELVKNEIHLGKEEMDVINSFIYSLGDTDIEGQKKNFNITIKKLESLEIKAEENRKKNEKLFRYLGVCTGMLIVIVLI